MDEGEEVGHYYYYDRLIIVNLENLTASAEETEAASQNSKQFAPCVFFFTHSFKRLVPLPEPESETELDDEPKSHPTGCRSPRATC